jgi:addiction module HigA family antidote
MAGSRIGSVPISNGWRSVSCDSSIRRSSLRIWPLHLAIGSNCLKAVEPDNTVFVSMTNGEFALSGGLAEPRVLKSSIITEAKMRDLPPIHPGEQLREEFMKPFGLTAYRLAKDTGVPVTRIQAIIAEKRGITGDTALRLARYFRTTPEFWLNMQRDYELEVATAALGDRLLDEVKPRAA